jgi:hypothetical protein
MSDKRIQITPYNYITIHYQDSNEVIFSWQDGRKHRAKVRQDQQGQQYFNTNKLSISLEQHKQEQKYYIAAYTGGNGIEYTRIFDNSLNDYKPFDSIEQAQAYIDSGELDEYVYYPSHIIYTKIITAQEKEQYKPDYRKLWLPLNKYPKGPFERNRV